MVKKLFKLANQYGRMVGLGMEGKRLKMVIHVKKVNQTNGLQAIYEIFKGLHEKKKTVQHQFHLDEYDSFGNY